MIITTYSDYNERKMNFFSVHDSDFRVKTSPLDEYNFYHKEYVFNDGAIWYEVIGPEYRTVEVEIHFVKMQVEVKLLSTEYWSSDNSLSEKYYEKY